jgi:hypothetical protein
MTEPFTLLINLGRQQPEYDRDFSRYSTYLALHVDRDDARLSLKIDNRVRLHSKAPFY